MFTTQFITLSWIHYLYSSTSTKRFYFNGKDEVQNTIFFKIRSLVFYSTDFSLKCIFCLKPECSITVIYFQEEDQVDCYFERALKHLWSQDVWLLNAQSRARWQIQRDERRGDARVKMLHAFTASLWQP